MINTDLIRLIHRFGSVVTDEELDEEIKICQSIIKDSIKTHPEPISIKARNALKILTREVDKRWWNRLRVSNKVSEDDLKYIKRLVELRYIEACKLEGKGFDISNEPEFVIRCKKLIISGAFSGFDLALEAFREVKGL